MKILLVGNIYGACNGQRYYMIMPKLVQGFARLGHNVYVYNDREIARARSFVGSRKFGIVPANTRLVEVARDFQPHLVLLGHCEMIWCRTLRKIREICPGVRIIYRNVDPLIHAQNVKDIERRAGVVDGIFLTTAGEALRSFARPETFIAFMPNPVDPSIEVGRSFERSDQENDVFFAGGPLGADHPRQALLQELKAALPGVRFDFRGQSFDAPPIFGAAYLAALANAKMGLNLSRTNDYYLYSSDRMAQYTGNGLLTFVHRGAGFGDIYGDDELAFYDSTEELIDKIAYFKEHDGERRKVAEKGWRKSHEYFDTTRVARYIVEQSFEEPFSDDYPWPTTAYKVPAQ
ncbi:MAG: glycosyltransferase [Nitrospirae bacterium]|nr:glycosyltransferase [Nitrospirota bacterium]